VKTDFDRRNTVAGEWLCGRLAGAVFRHHAVLIFELLFTLVLLVRAEVVVEHRTPRDQQTAIATLPKKPVAVLDSIEMIRVADAATTTAVSPDQRLVAHFSPDGKQFVVVLRKGNLKKNTNEYSLVLFHTADALHSPQPRTIATFSSASNAPGIQDVRWLDDSTRVAFLGERAGELQELYTVNCTTQKLKRLTNPPNNVASYGISSDGARIVFAADPPKVALLTNKVRRQGLTVSNELASDLIAGDNETSVSMNPELFVRRRNSLLAQRIDGITLSYLPNLNISPDGKYLIVQTPVLDIPEEWKQYQDKFLQFRFAQMRNNKAANNDDFFRYTLIDLDTRTSRPLLDSPIATHGSEVGWAPDSRSVVITGVFLPLNIGDRAELEARKARPYVVEIKIPTGEFVEITDQDLQFLRWNRENDLLFEVRTLDGSMGSRIGYQKVTAAWEKTEPAKDDLRQNHEVDVLLEEDINTPPRIFVVDRTTRQKKLLLDLNPQFRELTFGRVEAIRWKALDGHELWGGIYYPPDYEPGKRYPLVVQTHGFAPDRFEINGNFVTAAFAAQPLANKEFVVLQIGNDTNLKEQEIYELTPSEPERFMSGVEGAIQYLDSIGMIDPARVGIVGFSRTCFYVQYTLTHSTFRFAGALIADGIDGGYFQYLAYSNANPELASEFESINGGQPFGEGLSAWRKSSPGFRLNRVNIPIRLEAHSRTTLLGEWEWFSGLSRMGKPVELIYLPDGTHILEKPWERMVSQQGSVDWFCFWLKGEEDPDPAKAEQYKRWRKLRALQQANGARGKAGVPAVN